MSLKTLFAKIGDFFEGLFSSAKKVWNKLSPELQNAFLQGSGIISIINSNIDKVPDEVLAIISKKFPGLTREKLHEGLKKVADALNIGSSLNDESLETTITNIQQYLDKTQGEKWAGVSSLASKVIAFFLAPKGTKWSVFESLMEYVYHSFVKGKS